MSYADITIRDIFEVTRSGKSRENKYEIAYAWVEAENIMELRMLISSWFDLLESGEADGRHPSLNFTATQEEADHVIDELEADFTLERARFPDSDPNNGPGFNRLLPHSRVAFLEEIREKLKSSEQITDEANKRVNSGEVIPPEQ